MFVDTMLEALAVAKLLHEAGLPSDLSERENWSENVPLPDYAPGVPHRCFWDIYPRDLYMFYGARSVADVELIYRDGDGEFHTQPLVDITTSLAPSSMSPGIWDL